MEELLRKKKEKTAEKIIKNVQDRLVAMMPFLNRAILRMPVEFFQTIEDADDLEEAPTPYQIATDGRKVYADPDFVLKKFKENKSILPRYYMHMIFHCLFFHPFQYDKLNYELWDFSADLAVENTLLELKWKDMELPGDVKKRAFIKKVREHVGVFTAENIYAFYLDKANKKIKEEHLRMFDLFREDDHKIWATCDHIKGKQRMSNRRDLDGKNNYAMEEWKKAGKSIQLNVESMSRYRERLPGDAIDNIKQVFREKYSYRDFLRKFVARQEELKINQDEFDYIYYTYGMELYGNLPLIEPLEYRESQKIHDLVIAIDTSGSCQGHIVRSFLNKTYTMLKDTDAFSEHMNLHILQCDSKIQNAAKITTMEEFDRYMQNIETKGFGGTDFRPVFEYVEKQLRDKEFQNFRGLIYLTDGLGTYPEAVPKWPAAFVIIEDPKEKPRVPNWIIKLIMPPGELSEQEPKYFR